jgi:tRNA(adenine34) deaminase
MVDDNQDIVFMRLALAEAEIALQAGEFPVGCIITDGENVVASGFRQSSSGDMANELDHAEIMALKDLWKNRPEIPRDRLCLYSTLEPCLMCFGAVLISGITRIVYAFEDAMGGGTGLDRPAMSPLYRDIGLTVIPNVCRQESLKLLQYYFSDRGNRYLRNTLFEAHTMRQNRTGEDN